ncbi:alaserpin [Drosophila innubila]|uniref:alaserpin n=1 Tax=Drosophila innubila TaxID=198719 RepID=UPI00148C23A8|nr:alaserpin [Drosophila innubila]XP_034479528.1 alaserpin [Drosophila innubila]
MSCKYSSPALLLLLGSSLCLLSGSVNSTDVYTRVNNVVFGNREWEHSEPTSFQSRSGLGSPVSASAPAVSGRTDLQRPQPEPEQSWNGKRNPVRPAASAYAPAPAPLPAQDHASAAAPIVITGQNPDNRRVKPTVSTAGPTRAPAQLNYRERFSSVLFQPIIRGSSQKNVVYSPSSIHAMLGLLYGVSSGQTNHELMRAGQFVQSQIDVARDFKRVNELNRQLDNALLIVANKLFYNRELAELNPDYRRFAKEYYGADIEAVNMKRSANTAARINAWASDATNNIIRELVSPADIDVQTQAMLVNAIYFKARWATEFSAMDTTPAKFQVNRNAAVTVSMMYNDDIFAYAELPELDATAVELPYAGTTATMLLILPNQVDGLARLESQLANPMNDLNVIASRLRRETVTVRLPKFRIEFEQDMVSPLQQIGVNRMFTRESEIDSMLLRPVTVSKILQKAFIDVNEAGSEAAAASYAKFVPLSLPLKSREFIADHPFIFAIRTPESVLFIGHVVLPTQLPGTQ